MIHNTSKKIALCGILVALSIVLQWLGAITQIGSYLAAVFSGLCLIPINEESGIKYSSMVFTATTILSWLFIPDKEIPIVYCLFCFPLLFQYSLSKTRFPKFMQRLIQYGIFLCLILIIYPLVSKIFMMEDLANEFSMTANLVKFGFIGVTSIIFLLFINIYNKGLIYWRNHKPKYLL